MHKANRLRPDDSHFSYQLCSAHHLPKTQLVNVHTDHEKETDLAVDGSTDSIVVNDGYFVLDMVDGEDIDDYT